MKLLAIDTSTEACTVALWLDGKALERFERHPQHSERLLEMVNSLLSESAMSLPQLDAIAFGRGPGSFTGLRIGAGVTQGLAFAASLPVVPVSSLAALAQGVDADLVLAALDARMGQVYWGAYQRNHDGLMQPLINESVVNPASIVVPEGDGWVGAGSGWDAYPDVLEKRAGRALQARHREVLTHARHVAELGAAAYATGLVCAADQAIPDYLRNDVAVKAAIRNPSG